MKINTKVMVTLVLFALLGLSGCAHYNSRPLKQWNLMMTSKEQEQFLAFSYHVFTKDDCLKYLDRDTISKGYQPVQLSITNHSSRPYYFSTANMSVHCVSILEVAQQAHTSTIKRVVGYGIPGLFLWPFLIPAVVDGIGSAEANQQLDMDFSKKSLENQTISPFSTISGLIFVPNEHFDSQFSFTLIDPENHNRVLLATSSPRIKIKAPIIEAIKQH